MAQRWRTVVVALMGGAITALVLVGGLLWTQRGDVRVLSIDRVAPDLVQLAVDSCNAEHLVVVSDLTDGRYTVGVEQTSDGLPGADCADVVGFGVDPDLDTFEVEDLVSGEVFEWPPPRFIAAVEIEGRWRMTQVNGEPVEVGVNTIEVPQIEIEDGLLRGRFGGCDTPDVLELLVEEDRILAVSSGAFPICSLSEDGDELVPTERILRNILGSPGGATVSVNDPVMVWQAGGNELVFEPN